MIAVDEYNALFGDTAFGYEDKDLKPEDITVLEALMDVGPEGHRKERTLANGLFIGAVTHNYTTPYNFASQVNYEANKRIIPNYSKDELKSCLEYYIQIGFMFGS